MVSTDSEVRFPEKKSFPKDNGECDILKQRMVCGGSTEKLVPSNLNGPEGNQRWAAVGRWMIMSRPRCPGRRQYRRDIGGNGDVLYLIPANSTTKTSGQSCFQSLLE
jgi:hypothetical protein